MWGCRGHDVGTWAGTREDTDADAEGWDGDQGGT